MKSVVGFLLLLLAVPATARMTKQKSKNAGIKEIKSVTMHRTACYGKCPDYKIQISKEGMVTYTGIRFTDDTGVYQKLIGEDRAKEVINMYYTYQADTCQEQYENMIPDLPGMNFVIDYGTSKKEIHSANFGPAFLKKIGAAMDETGRKTDPTNWKKIGPVPPRR